MVVCSDTREMQDGVRPPADMRVTAVSFHASCDTGNGPEVPDGIKFEDVSDKGGWLGPRFRDKERCVRLLRGRT